MFFESQSVSGCGFLLDAKRFSFAVVSKSVVKLQSGSWLAFFA